MSGNIRYFSVAAMVVFGSVMVVRSISASPEPVLDDPPISLSVTRPVELEDASLAEVIHRFATLARAPRLDQTAR